MGINTDLNINPYFDDFDESKQYNRILFAPAKAVQARELTQLQTILQNQVERFGSNVYKEGTIITGINITERSDIAFVKLNDSPDFPDPEIYIPTETAKFFVIGETNGLKAEIIFAVNGFETRSPDLKTFFIKYLNTSQVSNIDIKEFEQGEVLRIVDVDETPISNSENNDVTVTVASVENHVGRSFGISTNEGIIYQKGHFIFAEPQFVIVSKYTNIPSDVSIGFTIQENIITSNLDRTLLDNAEGFNNQNAPGADRLQLKSILVSIVAPELEPAEFFALARYEQGEVVSIRDVTEFNSISTELARRTYEESGNYVVRGMGITLDQDENNTYAVVAPGKAYSFGYEINNISPKYLALEASLDTNTIEEQSTGIDYGAYYEFVWQSYNAVQEDNIILQAYDFDGTRYDLKDSANNIIGSCCVRNVTPGIADSRLGRIHIYAVTKMPDERTTTVAFVGNTPVVSSLRKGNRGANVFDVGKQNLVSIDNVTFTRRIKKSIAGNTSTVILESVPGQSVLPTNIYAVNNVNEIVNISSTIIGTDTVTVSLDNSDATSIYYDVIQSNVTADDLSEIDIYVRSVYEETTNRACLGIPNAVQLLSVVDDRGNGEDITSRFRLINNQKEGFYDISFIRRKAGENIPDDNNLLIKVKVLRRTSNQGGGFLSINSYNNVNTRFVREYTNRFGEVIDLLSAYDFRPYATARVSYSLSETGAENVSDLDLGIDVNVIPSVSGNITADLEYYLARIDSVVLDSSGIFSVVQGTPDENPVPSEIVNSFPIGQVYLPGNRLNIEGQDPVRNQTREVVRNYTMEDIGKIDRQVERLTETVSLNLLEQSTRDLFIPDVNGLNRFKNGILVDSFKNFSVADLQNPEHSSTIDKGYQIVSPKVKQFPVDLKVSSSTNVNNYQNVSTIADTGRIRTLISQPFATNVRNAVSNFYLYNGKAVISPQFDSGYNIVENPAVNFEVDITTPILDLVDNLQEFIPLTQTDVSRVVRNTRTGTRARGQRITTTTSTTRTVSELESEIGVTSQNIGTFVTDIAFNPYMQSQEMKILVTGLRPNTRHYFFFGETAVNEHVIAGTIVTDTAGIYDISNVETKNRNSGNIVRTDSNGVLAAVFIIPENTFFVGELDLEISDVSQYESISSGGTSYSRITYRAYNFLVGQTELNSTTRTVDFDVNTKATTSRAVTSRFIPPPERIERGADGGGGGGGGGDPLSQTFFVKSGMGLGASYVYINQLVVYFQSKSEINGVTMEIREVVNGFPSSTILPFGRKHLTVSQIQVSADSSVPTVVTFDNPIKLSVEKEYAFVIIPDANDPGYLVYTSQVGGIDLINNRAVTQDWGDGVLFTSTNNRAWQSYQTEDVKFEIRRLEFDTERNGIIDMIPDDPEYMSISNTVGHFRQNELVYAIKDISYVGVGITGREFTIPQRFIQFNVGDFVRLVQGDNDYISRIVAIQSTNRETTIKMNGPSDLNESSTEQVTATLVVSGRVSFYNRRSPDELHLKKSSSRTTSHFEPGDILIGYRSGATATLESVNAIGVSYMQTLLFTDNTTRTKTPVSLVDDNDRVLRRVPLDKNIWFVGNEQKIPSKTQIVTNATVDENFRLQIRLDNQEFETITPLVDTDISMINAYQYQITNSATFSSKYVSKQVVLQEDFSAVGMKMFLSAYRPPGTMIDVDARFTHESDSDEISDWIPLANVSSKLYSNISNTRDYREFEYELSEENDEYTTFQIRITMRHANQQERNEQNVTNSVSVGLFPHVYDYRAIALT